MATESHPAEATEAASGSCECSAGYWLVTTVNEYGFGTFAIEGHPADWITHYGGDGRQRKNLVFAMPISQSQHDALGDAGYC